MMALVQYSKFVVDVQPYCIWGWNLEEQNRQFISNLDPDYFEYLAVIHGRGLELEHEQQRAALALRTAYAHALETHFAMLFAALQAPDCVVGWVHKYTMRELRSLIQKVQICKAIYQKLEIKTISWHSICAAILEPISLEDKVKEANIKEHFARAWSRFARDFSRENAIQEYNSIKHGFRASTKAGGFRLAMGREDFPGVPAPPERMRPIAAGKFGSSFFIPKQISDNRNLLLRRQSRNWDPEDFVNGLRLIAMSLHNIQSFLKVKVGITEAEVQFLCPDVEAAFDLPWKSNAGAEEFGVADAILPQHISPFSKEEILNVYTNPDRAAG